MKTKILKIKGDWQEVVDDCRATVGKEPLGKEPSEDFKTKILISEHSPIRDISVKWRWENMPHWITVHWARHKWEKFIRTQRSDRTGVNRDNLSQSEPQDFTGEANVQHLIDTMRKRLCRQASPETRKYAEDFKTTLNHYEPEIAEVLVPNCVYRGGCPEMNNCGFYERIFEEECGVVSTDIRSRYKSYNRYFNKHIAYHGGKDD